METMLPAAASRRNYGLLVAEGVLFTVGLVFVDPNTILPLLMQQLTGSAVLVGLVGSIEPLAKGLAPLPAANWANAMPYKKRFLITAVAIGRLPLWLLAGSLLALSTNQPLYWAMLLLAVQICFWFGDAAGDPAWMDMVGKSVPDHRRGRFFASRQIIGGLLAAAAGLVTASILAADTLAFPTNYGVIIAIGALLYTANVGTFFGMVERPGSVSHRLGLWQLVQALPGLLKANRAFALGLGVLLLMNMTRISLPFYILFGRAEFGLGERALAVLLPLQMTGRIVGAAVWGVWGDRAGHQQAIRGVTTICFVIPAIAFFLPWIARFVPPLAAFALLFFLLGFFYEGWPPFINFMLAVVPEAKRTLYAGMMGIGMVPAALAPVAGGLLLGTVGYQSLFVLTACFTFTSMLLARRLPQAAPAQS